MVRAIQAQRTMRSSHRFIDRATLIIAILEPLVTLPQVLRIFLTHSASGISLTTWVGYDLLSGVWVWYAIVHKERAILVYQGLFIVMQTAIVLGGLLYGAKW